jgi:hypothetical protein
VTARACAARTAIEGSSAGLTLLARRYCSHCDLAEPVRAPDEIRRWPLYWVRRKEYLSERIAERFQTARKVDLLERVNLAVIQSHAKLFV